MTVKNLISLLVEVMWIAIASAWYGAQLDSRQDTTGTVTSMLFGWVAFAGHAFTLTALGTK